MSRSQRDSDRRVQTAQRHASLSRRRFLRGLGATIALPVLPSWLPRSGSAAALGAVAEGGSGPIAATSSAPLRTVYVYVPNGAIPAKWWPSGDSETAYTLNKTMEPLAELRDQFQILSGLACRSADPGPDGGGDHARAGGSFLTASRTRKSSTDIHTGVSIDQVIAAQVGHLTPLRSLELTCDAVHTSGSCDSGYSCAYSYNLSWRTPTSPVAPESNPRLVFERMFGYGAGDRKTTLQQRMARQKSILDFVLDDAQSARRSLNSQDRAKLDEYLTGLRDIEQRIEKSEGRPEPDLSASGIHVPAGIPDNYGEYIQLMFDMLVLAFQTDQTRVATFMMAHEGSNRPLPFLGIAEGHHNLSHHGERAEMVQKVEQIDRWYVEQFAQFLTKLANAPDVDGRPLLHNSMVLYGSGISDGNKHWHTNLPILLAGAGGGSLRPGRFLSSDETPIANLYLSLADRMGCENLPSHGDSTGRLTTI